MEGTLIDMQTEFGQRVARRLREEEVLWLTTVNKRQVPQPRPVWFLWDGESFLIFSRPRTYKVEHIRSNPYVALTLDSDGKGGDIVVLLGVAEILDSEPSAQQIHAFNEKYRDGFERIQMTPGSFAESYSVPLRVHPQRLRGH